MQNISSSSFVELGSKQFTSDNAGRFCIVLDFGKQCLYWATKYQILTHHSMLLVIERCPDELYNYCKRLTPKQTD